MLPTVFARGNVRTIKNLEKLRNQALSDKAPRVALRIQGILMSLERRSVNEIARSLHVHRSTVHSWILAWNEHREIGLLEGHRSGRLSKLSAEDKERLGDIVESGPVAYTGDDPRAVGKLGEERFHIQVIAALTGGCVRF